MIRKLKVLVACEESGVVRDAFLKMGHDAVSCDILPTLSPGRAELTESSLELVRTLLQAPIEMIALENPIGCISTRIRKPDQIIQPHEFGDDASKATCLWLKNLPKLTPTNRVAGRQVLWKGRLVERWANQTDSGQNVLGPSEHRWRERSKTYAGVADAMVRQWGGL